MEILPGNETRTSAKVSRWPPSEDTAQLSLKQTLRLCEKRQLSSLGTGKPGGAALGREEGRLRGGLSADLDSRGDNAVQGLGFLFPRSGPLCVRLWTEGTLAPGRNRALGLWRKSVRTTCVCFIPDRKRSHSFWVLIHQRIHIFSHQMNLCFILTLPELDFFPAECYACNV